jgi:hypothetical protein
MFEEAELRHALFCPTGKFLRIRVQPSRDKISLAPSGKSGALSRAVLSHQEGRTRNRHGRWVQDAVDALISRGERYNADGKVVWS